MGHRQNHDSHSSFLMPGLRLLPTRTHHVLQLSPNTATLQSTTEESRREAVSFAEAAVQKGAVTRSRSDCDQETEPGFVSPDSSSSAPTLCASSGGHTSKKEPPEAN